MLGTLLRVVGLFMSGAEGEADARAVTITPPIGFGTVAVEVTF